MMSVLTFLVFCVISVRAPGGDRDVHGCCASCGYVYCEARQKCIRPWLETCSATETTAVNDLVALEGRMEGGDYQASMRLGSFGLQTPISPKMEDTGTASGVKQDISEEWI
eukprot:GEMP01073443.1.p1 GENE.GEMP01073443.1~~GEMP01073443.1.p1  ORF type:complete len:111 (-),score=14.58 GEMP01073443.1:631-963(-)